MITPDYYVKFKCIGGECKNNCCKGGWEIEIDDSAVGRFGKIEGEFGLRVRDAISKDNTFKNVNGHCPLLNDDGWCEMALRGQELCTVCDEYPRFTEFFGDYCERGISLSCEAATEIILNCNDKVRLTGESSECDDEMFIMLFNARKTIFEILQNRDTDIFKRIRLVLDYGRALQEFINDNEDGEFVYSPIDCGAGNNDMTEYFEFLKELDILNPSWSDILNARESGQSKSCPELITEQLAVYFVYRYFLKAVFDCDALSKLKLMAVSVMAVVRLGEITGDIAECARLYSIEIEHNEENLEKVYDAFLFDEFLSYENIQKMIH